MVHCISLSAGERCKRSASTTTWSGRPAGRRKQLLPAQRDRHAGASLPHLRGAARFGSAHWKLAPLDEYCAGRAMAWIDDSLDESCYEWARKRRSRPAGPTKSDLGLEEAHTEALIAWARSLGGLRLTPCTASGRSSSCSSPQGPGPQCAVAGLVGEPRHAGDGRGDGELDGGFKRLRPQPKRPRGPRRGPHGGGANKRSRLARPLAARMSSGRRRYRLRSWRISRR